MHWPTLKQGEVLKEHDHKCRHIVTGVKGVVHIFAVFGVREPDADGLVDEKDVRMLIPGVRERFRAVRSCYSAGAFQWVRRVDMRIICPLRTYPVP